MDDLEKRAAPRKRAGGRPRSVPASMTPSDRAEAWTRALQRNGGHRLAVNLHPAAWAALQALAGKRKRGPLIERLILAEVRRLKAVDAVVLAEWERLYAGKASLPGVSESAPPRARDPGSRRSPRGG